MFIKIFLREFILILYARVFGYYKHISELPVYNWFQISEGDYTYLYKRRIKRYPNYFETVFSEMFFQFEKVDMTFFKDYLELSYLRSLFATTKRYDFLNKARSLEKVIKDKAKKEKKKASMESIITYIEETFNQIGSIDVHKLSTARFFSLYNRAIEKNANNKT